MPSWFTKTFKSSKEKTVEKAEKNKMTAIALDDVRENVRGMTMETRAEAVNIPSTSNARANAEGKEQAISVDKEIKATDLSVGSSETASTTPTQGKKMSVDDFEPLKIIGRGAFGASRGARSRRARARERVVMLDSFGSDVRAIAIVW